MRFEMMKVLKGRQDRFIYYIAGLNVAAIGFTVSKTFDFVPNHGRDILLGLALILWFISTITSFRWIIIQFRTMERNLEIKGVSDGYFDKEKIDKTNKKTLTEVHRRKLEEDGLRSEKALKATVMLFLSGIVVFIFWRVLDVFQY